MADPIASPEDQDLSGTVIDNRYDILRRESQGGMGAIYKARHVILESLVAVKVMLKPRNMREQERFLQEAQLASKVRHPNTVYLSDFGILPDGQPYLVMEFLSGRTLSQELLQGPLAPRRVCQIGAQIARGLQAVHEKGVVHRDLKPPNIILLEQDGTRDFVKIVDFGLAQSQEVSAQLSEKQAEALLASAGPAPKHTGRARLSQAGFVIGTPRYMPPEQAADQQVDARADQYALGCVLYEMLCGEAPFTDEDTLTLLFKHLNLVPPSLRQRAPAQAISESLEALVLRLLAKSPSERFATMRDVELALQAEAERLQPSSASAVPRPAGRRETFKRAAPALALAAVVLGAALLGYRMFGNRDGESLRPGEMRQMQERAMQVLQQELQSGPRELRLAAIAALGQTHDAALRPQLSGLLSQADIELQSQAADALGQLGDREAIAALAELLQRTAAAPVRVGAAGALARLGDERGRSALERMVIILGPADQLRAAFLLGELGAVSARDVLSAYLTTRGAQLPDAVRLDVLECLARLGDDAARRTLREQMQGSGPNALRLAAAARLAKLPDSTARDFLSELAGKRGRDQLIAARLVATPDDVALAALFRHVLQDRGADLAARVLAAEGLGKSGRAVDTRLLVQQLSPSGEPALRHASAVAILELAANDPSSLSEHSLGWARSALGDRDWLIRQSGAAALGDNAAVDTVPLLAAALKDSVADVRRSPARALGRRSERAALSALREALRDGDADVRLEALRSVARLAQSLRERGHRDVDAGMVQALNDVKQGGSPAEKILAASALLRLNGSDVNAELLAFAGSDKAELRRLFVEQLSAESSSGTAALSKALSDPELAVRFAAARRLAEHGDRRALPVLREALQAGGPDALAAYGLLRRLGEKMATPTDVLALLKQPSPELRMSAIEALAALPAELAVPLLNTAARDLEPLVRRLVVEVAADLPAVGGHSPGEPVVRLLVEDPNGAVRARAQAVLARLLLAGTERPGGAKPAVEKAPLPAAAPLPPGRNEPSSSSSPATEVASAARGLLQVKGSELVHFQVDELPVQSIGSHPLPLSPGVHHVVCLGGNFDVQISAGQTATLALPDSPRERAVHDGIAAFQRGDYAAALRLLERASKACEHERALPQVCAPLLAEVAFNRARVFDAEHRRAEAANEYQRVMDSGAKQKISPAHRLAAQEALAQLTPRLGQVVLRTKVKGRCKESMFWLEPGKQNISIGGRHQEVTVKVRQRIELGACS